MRIPFALQTVFLQSQAGEDVEKIAAPTGGVSSKAYPPKVPTPYFGKRQLAQPGICQPRQNAIRYYYLARNLFRKSKLGIE